MPIKCVFLDSNSLEDFSFLDIFKMSNFHFLEKVSESEVFKKHVQSIMQSFGFFLEIFDCIFFFIILMRNDLGDFFVRILY